MNTSYNGLLPVQSAVRFRGLLLELNPFKGTVYMFSNNVKKTALSIAAS